MSKGRTGICRSNSVVTGIGVAAGVEAGVGATGVSIATGSVTSGGLGSPFPSWPVSSSDEQ